FYGWWIVAAGGGLQLLQSSLLGQAYGADVVLLRDDFGWSKTALAAASSMREAESGLTSPFQGWLLDRFGPRRVAATGVVIFASGFMLFSQVNSLLTFYLAFFVMSVGASLGGWLTVTFTTVQWFERKRATAIALTTTGFAAGGMLVPLTALVLEGIGWRQTALFSGIVILLVGLPLTRVLRASPEQMGLRPDGVTPGEEADARAARSALVGGTARVDFTLGQALRTPAFWWISLGHASALFVVSAMGVHLVSHLKESQGYSLGQASTVVFLLTGLLLIGTISGGLVGDRINKRLLLVCCMAMHATGLLILSHAVNVWMVLAFVLLHGLAWGWRGPQMAAIRADYFGRASFGKILGVSNMVIIVGTISGPVIAGLLYDQTGNYRLGFDILAGIAATGSVFFILARPPSPPGPVSTGVERGSGIVVGAEAG
ncbi:MAG: MFS transporter, partial [Gemmatimonadales bacterium]